MAIFTVIRIFLLTIFFNILLPSGDVYSDLALMLQTWKFENIDSLEMSGCRACFSKEEKDLIPTEKECTTCITKNKMCRCGHFISSLNKLLEIIVLRRY